MFLIQKIEINHLNKSNFDQNYYFAMTTTLALIKYLSTILFRFVLIDL